MSQEYVLLASDVAGVPVLPFSCSGTEAVRRVAAGSLAPGSTVAEWDGRDTAGQLVRDGTYFAQVVAGSWVATGRVVLVR